MNLTSENILLIGSILLFLSLLAGKTSFRFGIPVLALFIAVGMLAGSEGIGGIYFNNPKITQFIGVIALNFILFSGGLDTSWQSVKPVFKQGVMLSTVGVLLTSFSLGLFVWWITDFTIYESLLLGSIVSSTDSAAVFTILRSRKLALKGNLRSILELESGSNDPMAYVLTLAFTGLVVNQESSLLIAIPILLKQLIIGILMGLILGKLSKLVINSIQLEYEGMYIVLLIAIMTFSFSATDFVGGNGFLAVYLCAIYLGNHDLMHKKKIIKSFDSFAWLMQIVLFLTLGLLVYPSQLLEITGIGLIISGFLILIARPFSVFLSLLPFHIQNRSRLFISWVGLRGAVPIVFATYPLLAGIEKANMIFYIVFFISLTSLLIQGTTLPLIAKWLHLTVPEKVKQRSPTDIEINNSVKSFFSEIKIPEDCNLTGKPIVELGLPKTALISVIERDGKYITPIGSTVLQVNDKLFVISENKTDIDKLIACIKIDAKAILKN